MESEGPKEEALRVLHIAQRRFGDQAGIGQRRAWATRVSKNTRKAIAKYTALEQNREFRAPFGAHFGYRAGHRKFLGPARDFTS
eukprot:2720081-Pyramimonas_sp.AAC.1